MSGIWKTWMRVWFAAALLFGAVLSLAAVPGADGPARRVLATISGDPAMSAMLDLPVMRFAVAAGSAATPGRNARQTEVFERVAASAASGIAHRESPAHA